MCQWEYLTLDLNDTPRRGDETTVLNRAGNEGVGDRRLAILKREIALRMPGVARRRRITPEGGSARSTSNFASDVGTALI
jgi:hypothetical protein